MVTIVVRKVVVKINKQVFQNQLEIVRKRLSLYEGFTELQATINDNIAIEGQMELQMKLSFNSYHNLKKWEEYGIRCLSIFGPLNDRKPQIFKSSYWKGVAKNILTLYPLILIVDWVLASFFPMDKLRPQEAIFFNLLVVVLLMQYSVSTLIRTTFRELSKRYATHFYLHPE